MIEFKQITIQNFLSFGHKPITILLNKHNTTLILGVNKDVGAEGYSRNGVGKSSIFQALTWVLFNEGISNIKQDAFVNIINKKKMVVELEMTVDDIEFVIRRGRKPAVCEVLKDGEPYTMHSAATVDETIEKLIGINFDTWCNTEMLNTTTTPFMGMKPSPQRDFMEKMVGLDVLSERATTLKSKNKDVIVEIKLEEQNKVHVVSNYDKTQSRIDTLDNQSKNWIQNHVAEIKDTETEIKGLSVIDVEKTQKNNQAIRKQKEDIDKIRVLIEEINTEESQWSEKAKTTYHALKLECENNANKTVTELESNYNLEVSELKARFQEERSKLKSDANVKSLDMVTEKSELEKTLIEKRALLKESNGFLTTSALQLKKFIDDETKFKEELKILKDGICPYCKQSHVDNNRIDEINNEIIANYADSKEVNDDVDRVMDGVNELKDEITSTENTLKELTELTDNIHGEFNKLLIEYQGDQADELKILEDKFETKLKELDTKLDKELDDLKEEYDSSCVSSGMEVAANKESYEEDIKKLTSELKEEVYSDAECIEIISTLKNLAKQLEKLNGETNPYIEQLRQSKTELVEYDDSVLFNLKEKESHYKLLIKMLTDNKSFIRKNLLDQYVPYINQKIAEYTMKLELPHIVTINNDLTVDIDYMQNSVSYGNLSNGERGRLDFSVSMAFRDLLSVSGYKFNFLGIDELLDNGIDTSGFHAIFKLLKEHKNENVFLISHRDDLITEVDSIMRVVKENGFTHII